MKKTFLLFLVIPFVCLGQYEKEIDSLNKIIKSKTTNIKKADAYRSLVEFYFNLDFDKAQKSIDELSALNKNNSCLECDAMADFLQGHYYNYSTGDNKKAMAYYEKSIQKAFDIPYDDLYLTVNAHYIQSLMNLKEYEKTEQKLNDIFNFYKKGTTTDYIDSFYYLTGVLNHQKGFYTIALENFIKADKLYVKNKVNDPPLRISYIDRISMLYTDIKNYPKAREYNDLAIKLSKETNDLFSLINVYYHRGVSEYKAREYNEALSFLEKGYAVCIQTKNTAYQSAFALYLSRTNLELNNLPNAIKFNKEAMDGFTSQKNIALLTWSYDNQAKIYLRQNKYAEAKKLIDECKLNMKDRQDSPDYLLILGTEISYLKKTNNLSKAIEIINKKDSLETILDKKNNSNTLNELGIKYDSEKKEQQIKLLSTQNELAQKQKYIYISLLGLLVLIGGSLFYAYRNKIKTAQKLNELNELKSRFFANISHEFRTPLTLIKSPVQSLQSEITDDNQKNKLNLIDINSTRMLQLVDQLLELSKIDSGNLKLILKDGNISSFLTSIIEPFQFQSKEKGIHFTSNIQKAAENNSFDKDVIEKIVTNLVSNAFKYAPEKETISFTSSLENSILQLKVSNTGSDVKKEDLPKLFERFYQKNETQQGVGIGLALVKELVDLYQGTITTSVENGTLSFVVNLPLGAANENAVVIPAKVSTPISENSIDKETELPILLVVDDNAEIRSILKDLFRNDYQILEAQDGEEALQLAQNQIPDCIISDVMMPKMDGFEFTKAIKNNELTSFIPVVLLTAKTSDEAHLEGLKSTADAFLTKPFNNEIVKATVQQLISERKKLHARYSQELVLRPVDIVINSAEEKFIERLQAILDKNISNSEYTAEDFATEIGMSRMQLHRKLKSLLGVSATEFLRNERLKVGAELLKKGNGNISEIAYSVGFSDVSYFSKCFKEMYQCTPTEYVNWK